MEYKNINIKIVKQNLLILQIQYEYDYFNKNEEEKEKLLLKLYNDGKIDKILNKGRLNYLEFKELKYKNKLSLARVNELHN